MAVKIKRVYKEKSQEDGIRILVDRLWPRGVSKEAAGLDDWYKELGPSDELRKWFNHEDDKYPEFKRRYIEELSQGQARLLYDKLVKLLAEKEQLTLVYSAKNENYNQARVLADLLEGKDALK